MEIIFFLFQVRIFYLNGILFNVLVIIERKFTIFG